MQETVKVDYSLPDPLKRVLKRIEEHDFEAYVVGGAVRDILLSKNPDDFDVTTSATPEELLEIFGEKNFHPTGIKHGTVTIVEDGFPVEITTFRVDGDYTDSRHPDEVRFTRSLKEDVMRRDFTINAMALGEDGRIIDYCGGVLDLKARIIRTVGEPKKRFEEDALRILRGLRFSAELGFSIDEETSKEILRQKEALCNLSVERIWKEFSRLLCGAYCVPVLRKYFEVFSVFIPEIRPMKGFEQHNPHHIYDVWEHTLVSVLSVRPELVLRLTMLLHDIGKPSCFEMDEEGVGHFRGHMKISAEMADTILHRLKVDTQTRETAVLLIKAHDVAMMPVNLRMVRRRLAQYGEENLRRLLDVKRADTLAHSSQSAYRLGELQKFEDLLDQAIREKMCFSYADLEITGKDLIELGIPAGPVIGKVKKQLLDEVVDGLLKNEKKALNARAADIWASLK